jgi:hypothetical protein
MFGRAVRWLRAEAAFVLVVILVLVAILVLLLDPRDWRPGAGILAAALLLAGVLRLVVPQSAAGMLAVRGRWRDALFYVCTGAVILGVALRLHTNGSTG